MADGVGPMQGRDIKGPTATANSVAKIDHGIASNGTLPDAQVHPENYKTLVVRVAGYSALFTTLSKSLQDDIIKRTEQGGF